MYTKGCEPRCTIISEKVEPLWGSAFFVCFQLWDCRLKLPLFVKSGTKNF